MAKRNLSPTPIVDKNGKQTTIYRADPSHAPSSTIPRVLRSLKTTHGVPRNGEPGRSLFLMENAMIDTPRIVLTDGEIETILSGIYPETFDTLDSVTGLAKGAGRVVSLAAENCVKERSAATYNNFALFCELADSPDKIYDFTGLISGLFMYSPDEEDHIDYTTASSQDIRDARNLIKVALELGTDYQKYTFRRSVQMKHLASPAFVELIRKRPDDVDRMIALMKIHNEMRVKTPKQVQELEQMLDSAPTQSLVDGVL